MPMWQKHERIGQNLPNSFVFKHNWPKVKNFTNIQQKQRASRSGWWNLKLKLFSKSVQCFHWELSLVPISPRQSMSSLCSVISGRVTGDWTTDIPWPALVNTDRDVVTAKQNILNWKSEEEWDSSFRHPLLPSLSSCSSFCDLGQLFCRGIWCSTDIRGCLSI